MASSPVIAAALCAALFLCAALVGMVLSLIALARPRPASRRAPMRSRHERQ